MKCHQEMQGRKAMVTPLTNDCAASDQQRGTATAEVHRDIQAILPGLRRYALTLTRDVNDADDLVQDCVLRALAKLNLWKAGTDLKAWLFTILRNQYINQIRHANLAGARVKWNEHAPALACSANQMEHIELCELGCAIMLLPEEQRKAILLGGLTKLSYDEIAVACNVPVGTIRSRMARGRAMLRNLTGLSPSAELRVDYLALVAASNEP